jgi:hypothetical protein
VVLLLLILVGVVACNSEPVYQRYLRVSLGMTYSEVVRIMDGTSSDGADPGLGRRTWGDSGGTAYIFFEDGRVTKMEWRGWP